MCLSIVKPLPENPESVVGEGYKVLMPHYSLRGEYWGPIMTAPCGSYRPQEEVAAKHPDDAARMVIAGSVVYPAGFHIFEQEKHAWGYLSDFLRDGFDRHRFDEAQVWRVGYRHLVACGTTYWDNIDVQCLDWSAPTVVTKYMTLLEECKK